MEKPLVVVTRPAESAQVFVDDLRVLVPDVEVLVVPAFELRAVEGERPPFDVAIFTSTAGVGHAPKGAGRLAYCVGASTAKAAERAGYEAVSADGAADDLTALILEARPTGKLLHLRGEVAKGDIAATLQAEGLDCRELVVYQKVALTPDALLLDQIEKAARVIWPMFSGETVSIIESWGMDFTGATVVAISKDVAQAARALVPSRIIRAERPDRAAMTQATVRMIA